MKKVLLISLSVLCVCIIAACRMHDHAPSTVTTTGTPKPTQPTFASTDPTAPPTSTAVSVEWTHEAALIRFLTETKQNGEVTSSPDTPPGGLPPIENIPQPDQTLVGRTVMIILAQEQQAIPFYYYCDANTTQERLAVIISADRIPMMIIFETNLGGSVELCKKIAANEAFEAVILAMTNVSFEEGMSICNASDLSSDEQQIDIFTASTQDISGEYIGTVGTHSSGRIIYFLAGAESSQIRNPLRSNMNIWYRVFQRFHLLDIINKQ